MATGCLSGVSTISLTFCLCELLVMNCRCPAVRVELSQCELNPFFLQPFLFSTLSLLILPQSREPPTPLLRLQRPRNIAALRSCVSPRVHLTHKRKKCAFDAPEQKATETWWNSSCSMAVLAQQQCEQAGAWVTAFQQAPSERVITAGNWTGLFEMSRLLRLRF